MAWRRIDIGGVQAGSGWRRPDMGAAQAEAEEAPTTTGMMTTNTGYWGALSILFVVMIHLSNNYSAIWRIWS